MIQIEFNELLPGDRFYFRAYGSGISYIMENVHQSKKGYPIFEYRKEFGGDFYKTGYRETLVIVMNRRS